MEKQKEEDNKENADDNTKKVEDKDINIKREADEVVVYQNYVNDNKEENKKEEKENKEEVSNNNEIKDEEKNAYSNDNKDKGIVRQEEEKKEENIELLKDKIEEKKKEENINEEEQLVLLEDKIKEEDKSIQKESSKNKEANKTIEKNKDDSKQGTIKNIESKSVMKEEHKTIQIEPITNKEHIKPPISEPNKTHNNKVTISTNIKVVQPAPSSTSKSPELNQPISIDDKQINKSTEIKQSLNNSKQSPSTSKNQSKNGSKSKHEDTISNEDEDLQSSLLLKNTVPRFPHPRTVTILDFEANPTPNTKINSPRSIIALKETGMIIEDLYFIPPNRYPYIYPEVRQLPPDLQEKQYNFYEERRKEKLNKVIEARSKIEKDEVFQYSNSVELKKNKTMMSSTSKNKLDTSKIRSTSVTNDLKQYERMKQKNELEIIRMFQSEIRKEEMIKESERKMKLQKEKAEQFQRELKARRDEEERIRKEKEKEKERQMLEEEKRKREIENKRREEERIKQEKEKQLEKERMIQAKKKEIEDAERKKKFQEKVEHMLLLNQKQIEEKQKEIAEKEIKRKQILEQKRIIKAQEIMRQRQIKQAQIDQNQVNLENQLNSIRKAFLKKQKLNEKKKQKFEEMKKRELEKQKEESLKKQEEIKLVLERNSLQEKQKIKEYNEKQKVLMEKKAQMEELIRIEQEKKSKLIKEKQEHIKITLLKNEQLEREKRKQILQKIENKALNLSKSSDKRQRINYEKIEQEARKKFIREDNLRIINRIQQYEREKASYHLIEKDKKMEELNIQKVLIKEQKQLMQTELKSKREELTEKISQIFDKKKFDDSTIEELKEIFPENENFEKMLHRLKNIHSNENSSLTSLNNTTINKTQRLNKTYNTVKNKQRRSLSQAEIKPVKKIIPQTTRDDLYLTQQKVKREDIEIKVRTYRKKLNYDLMKVLDEERKKEQEREIRIAKIEDQTERDKLDKQYGTERAEASRRIIAMNEDINKKCIEYEAHLREDKKK